MLIRRKNEKLLNELYIQEFSLCRDRKLQFLKLETSWGYWKVI